VISVAGLMTVDATAQTFPARPITLIFPFSPGSAGDLFTRALASEGSRTLGQPIVVENRPGAGGRTGMNAIVSGQGDGYLLSFANLGMCVIQPLASTSFKLEPGKDYTPVLLVFEGSQAVYANPSVPFRDLKGLIAYAKANPGKLNSGSSGSLGTGHLALELLKAQAGIDVQHVAYKGEPQSIAAAVGGEIQLLISPGGPKPQVDAGRLVVIATTGENRWDTYPDRPTLREAGLPDYSFSIWGGVVAPPGTPAETVAKLNAAFSAALKSADARKGLNALGAAAPADTSAERFAAVIRSDLKRLAPVIAGTGLKAD
jgi:tripartite-type tricarboxylate transporter receptor subunit TctC